VLVALAVAAVVRPAAAQDPAIVEAAAPVLRAEDTRAFEAGVFEAASRHGEPVVRRIAAVAMGRIGDSRALPLLLELVRDPDSTVARDAAFALGLLRDPEALPTLRELMVTTPPDQQHELHAEAMRAVLRTGGAAAAEILAEVLNPWVARASSSVPPLSVEAGLWEAWRLGQDAPAAMLVEFMGSPVVRNRLGALYSLGRLRAPGGAAALLEGLGDADPEIRRISARALTAAFADTAGLDRMALASQIRRLTGDDDAQVRINALRTLGTFRDSSLAPAVLDRLADGDPGVRVQAMEVLADLGGSTAVEALRSHIDQQPFALQRAALVGYARLAKEASLDAIAEWLADTDWNRRAAGAEALGHITRDTVVGWLTYLATQDQDPKVAAVALTSLAAVAPDTATIWSRQLIGHRDPVVRAIAAERLGAAANPADIARLTDAFQLALRDPIPDARIAIVGALGRIAEVGLAERLAVQDRFLKAHPRVDDYLVRRAAAERFPEAARRWGPERPIQSPRGLEDYREITRRYLAGPGGVQTIVLDTDRGRIVIDLFGRDAPITVNAFLQLVDQRFFDGRPFHRVVPNFVVQSGDPRGDGWGGPGFSLRDEINPNRYDRGTVGMALSGPDTGGSQFFITHSRQPHLDGTYPVIGRVISGMDVVDLITQGDRIQTIRRQ
jgi:cyclophilin family peptidyl-prolyl cis-trans isomerase/HEAT repeat protein